MEITSFWKVGEVDHAVFSRFAGIVHDGGLISRKIDAPALLIDRAATRKAALSLPQGFADVQRFREVGQGGEPFRLVRGRLTQGKTWNGMGIAA